MKKNDSLYIVMPAYNEEQNIESVVKQWHPLIEKINDSSTDKKSKLIIANDGSKDNTFEIMLALAERYQFFEPINKQNSGHGSTLSQLYRKAILEEVDYVFQTDSDGQTDPNEFWQMWNDRKGYDFQIGIRNARQDGTNRVVVTRVLSIVVRIIFRVSVPDSNTPFRLMKTKRLNVITSFIPTNFFLYNVAISAIAVKKGESIKWHSISFKQRQGGENSINLKRIIKIGWKSIGELWLINKNLNK